jgi:hypothetical protein
MHVNRMLRPTTARLSAVLIVSCLTVALMAAGAQAQPAESSGQAALGPATIEAVDLDGDCYVSNRWGKVYAHMGAWVSGTTGTGYLNIYRRFASGNLLLSHKTATIRSHSLTIDSSVRKASGGRYFATWGINSSSGDSSGGMSCPVLS